MNFVKNYENKIIIFNEHLDKLKKIYKNQKKFLYKNQLEYFVEMHNDFKPVLDYSVMALILYKIIN